MESLLNQMIASQKGELIVGVVKRLRSDEDRLLALQLGVAATREAQNSGTRKVGVVLLKALCADARPFLEEEGRRGTFAALLLPPAEGASLLALAALLEVVPPGWPASCEGEAIMEACVDRLASGVDDEDEEVVESVAELGWRAVRCDNGRLQQVLEDVFKRLCDNNHRPSSRSLGRLVGRIPLTPELAGFPGSFLTNFTDDMLVRCADGMSRWRHSTEAPNVAAWVLGMLDILRAAGRDRALALALSAATLLASTRLVMKRSSDADAEDVVGCAELLGMLLQRQSETALWTVLPNLVAALRDARLPSKALTSLQATLRLQLDLHPEVKRQRHDLLRLLGPPPPPSASSSSSMLTTVAPPLVGPAEEEEDAGGSEDTAASSQPAGLRNLGNSCYLNATLRALELTRPLRELLVSAEPSSSSSSSSSDDGKKTKKRVQDEQQQGQSVTGALRETVALLRGSKRSAVSAAVLKKSLPPPFDAGAQQDAAEVLHYLLDALDREAELETTASDSDDDDDDSEKENEVKKKKPLEAIFGGRYETTIVCGECGAASRRSHELGGEIALSLEQQQQQQQQHNTINCEEQQPTKRLKLEAMVARQYLGAERLEGENAYDCEACAKLVGATKTGRFVEAPSHLLVALSRFRYDRISRQRAKINTQVDLPPTLELPLGNNNGPPARYSLYAVVVHEGATPHHGHYYTYGLDSALATSASSSTEEASRWRLYDDDSVKLVADPTRLIAAAQQRSLSAPHATPYILCYARQGCSPLAPERPMDPTLKTLVDDDNARFEASKKRARITPYSSSSSFKFLPPRTGDGGGGGPPAEPSSFGGIGGGSWGVS